MAFSYVFKRRTLQNLLWHVFNPPRILARSASVDSRYFLQGTTEDLQLSRPVKIAGRKYLPSSFVPGFPEQLSSPSEGFPLVLQTKNDAQLEGKGVKFWSECFREQILKLYKDFQDGGEMPVAVLVRGLPIKTIKDFSKFVQGLNFEFFSYHGGSGIREKVDDFVSTGAREPKEYTIELHNEMSYGIDYPTMFVITCLKKAKFGGETAICNGRELTEKIDAGLMERFERKGIRYLRYLLDQNEGKYNSWQRSLMTEHRSDAEKFLTASGYSFKWEGENLVYWHNAAPTIIHPLTGEKLWFNQAFMMHSTFYKAMPLYEDSDLPDEKYPSHTIHADGDVIDLNDLHSLRCTAWNTAVGISLQESDVLFLDNLAVLHSRLSYDGHRVVGTCMLK